MARRRHGLDFGSLCPALCHHEPPCVLGYHGGLRLAVSKLLCTLNLKRASAQLLETTQPIGRGQGLAPHWSPASPSIHSWSSPLFCHVSASSSKGQMPQILLHTLQALVSRQYMGHWAICDVAVSPLPDGSLWHKLWGAWRSCELV